PFRSLCDKGHYRVLVREKRESQPVGVQAARQFADCGRRESLHARAKIILIQTPVDRRDALDRLELSVVLGAVSAERADIVEAPWSEPEQVIAGRQLAVRGALADILDDRLVEAGRHEIDEVHCAGELIMLARRDLAG